MELSAKLRTKQSKITNYLDVTFALTEKVAMHKEVVENEKEKCVTAERKLSKDASLVGSLKSQLRGIESRVKDVMH